MSMTRKGFLETCVALGFGTAIALSPASRLFAQQDVSLESRISQLQQKVQADSRNPDLHFELSKLYEENIQYDEALSEFGLSVDNGLKNQHFGWTEPTKLLSAKGSNDLINEREYDKAINSFEKIVELTPNNPHAYKGIGVAYYYKGEYDKAVAWLKKAIDLKPVGEDGKSFYNVMGFIQISNENFESALLNFDKIKLLEPKTKEVYFGIGQARQGLGQYDEAIRAYKKHLKYNDSERAKALIKECKRLK